MTGLKRNLLPNLEKLLKMFPVVAIIGARQVGKTTLAQQLCLGWKYLDLENPDDFHLLSNNPTIFFRRYPEAVVIDEAQVWPGLFPVLRSVVDNDRGKKGSFVITGSSSPELRSQISESLAGRIAVVELGTFKANEFFGKPLSPFYGLFKAKISIDNILLDGDPPLSSSQVHELWLNGGYPEPTISRDPEFQHLWMKNYRDTYINRDISALFPRLNKNKYQRFVTILSKLSGALINKRDLGRAVEVSETTIREYLSIAEGTFIWRNLLSFEKNVTKSIVKMPKGYIRDTGLLHFLLRIASMDELMEAPEVGASFEVFVIEEVLKGLGSLFVSDWGAYYYRTRGGAEVDLILEGGFGVLPIEIKYGTSVRLKELKSLSGFVRDHNLPLGIIINQGDSVEFLDEKIVQIPVGWI